MTSATSPAVTFTPTRLVATHATPIRRYTLTLSVTRGGWRGMIHTGAPESSVEYLRVKFTRRAYTDARAHLLAELDRLLAVEGAS